MSPMLLVERIGPVVKVTRGTMSELLEAIATAVGAVVADADVAPAIRVNAAALVSTIRRPQAPWNIARVRELEVDNDRLRQYAESLKETLRILGREIAELVGVPVGPENGDALILKVAEVVAERDRLLYLSGTEPTGQARR